MSNPNGGPGRNPLGVPVKPPPDLKLGVKPIHDAIIDAIIAQPTVTPLALSVQFGYSVEWMRILMRTDAFRERLATRKEEIVDPILSASVEERLSALADLSIQRLLEKLGTNPSDNLALKAAEISTKALGYGARTPQVAVSNYIAVVPQQSATSEDWERTYTPPAPASAPAPALPNDSPGE